MAVKEVPRGLDRRGRAEHHGPELDRRGFDVLGHWCDHWNRNLRADRYRRGPACWTGARGFVRYRGCLCAVRGTLVGVERSSSSSSLSSKDATFLGLAMEVLAEAVVAVMAWTHFSRFG